MLAGDFTSAEVEARVAHEALVQMGDVTYQSSEAHLIAQALEAQGRVDDAERWLERSFGDDDSDPDSLTLRAQILMRRDRLEDAERLARSALALGAEPSVPQFADARFVLAGILARQGANGAAREHAERCLRRYEAKGIVPLMERARALIAALPPAG